MWSQCSATSPTVITSDFSSAGGFLAFAHLAQDLGSSLPERRASFVDCAGRRPDALFGALQPFGHFHHPGGSRPLCGFSDHAR